MTITFTESEAFDAMLSHHRSLAEQVAKRAAALSVAAGSDGTWEPAVADLVAFLAEEVLPHALAEEASVYRAAGARADLEGTVAEMMDEHRHLTVLVERLAMSTGPGDAVERADTIGSLFTAHVAKENDLILPVLRDDPEVDLGSLLGEMQRLTEAAGNPAAPVEDSATPAGEVDAELLSLFLEGALGLAGAGQADQACRLAARAWAVLRGRRPVLAVRVTAALHGLARSATEAPVSFTRSQAAGDPTLDVREMAPAARHESIFAAFEALAAAKSFVLVNDHDPKPLRYQFEAEHPGEFTWDYLEAGPKVWRVRIGRPRATEG
ncbi:MAG: DUF2249 domain-containing protein [Acidimicrobiales bacterium]